MSLLREIAIPDIGDFKNIPIIEVRVSAGDEVAADDTLVVLESDKAVLEVPSPSAGIVREVKVAPGDRVSQGSVVVALEPTDAGSPVAPKSVAAPPSASVAASVPAPAATAPAPRTTVGHAPVALAPSPAGAVPHASPSLRRFARELGVDLTLVRPSGPKGRIRREDVQRFVKTALERKAPVANDRTEILPWPKVDFAKFGPIDRTPLSKIRRLSGANLARNWAVIPHVTNFDEADITELEAFRIQINKERAATGGKLTMLAFLIKASAAALAEYPEFNASLDGEELILKRYYHIGFAADTPNGLIVPVIRDADRKGLGELAAEAASLAAFAREGKLKPADMQGGTFTVSSLGGIGGTGFTPIINAPEIAILGAARAQTKPVWDGSQFRPRLILPLSLSWDHRVVDGVAAARFLGFLTSLLADFRRVAL